MSRRCSFLCNLTSFEFLTDDKRESFLYTSPAGGQNEKDSRAIQRFDVIVSAATCRRYSKTGKIGVVI